MPGLKIVIPTIFTDVTLPVLRADPILPESGALLLLDMAHPASGTIVLASGAKLTNIAAPQAAALLAVAESATHAELTYTGMDGTAGVIELTDTGGIHAILAASSSVPTMAVRPAQAVVDHLVANPDNDYYVSLWFLVTRVTNTNAAWSAISFSADPAPLELLYSFANHTTNRPLDTDRIGFRAEPVSTRQTDGATPGPYIRTLGISAYSGTPTKTGTDARDHSKVFAVGNVLPFGGVATGMSGALYRYYLEDLTVSGRTWAEVDAIDHGLYTTEVLTSGGRYYGDTYTDPATIP